MKILVTGGAGFVGHHLIKSLKENYTEVQIYSLDNYSSGKETNHVADVHYIKGNTWDILQITELQEFEPDYVYHFGEFSRIFLSFSKVNETFQSNTFGTQQVLEYCVSKKAKLIYSGSSAIFGNNKEDQHLNPYSWTKAKNIELIKNYHNWFGIEYAICYFYNVFGGKQIVEGDYATVIGIFENQYKKKELLTVVTPGTQKRCFTHVDDIVKGILLVGEKGTGDEYFLGSGESYSILEIVQMFKSKFCLIAERKGERKESEIKKGKIDELNWKAEISIKNYIENLINSI